MNISERNENLFRIAIRNLSFAKIKHKTRIHKFCEHYLNRGLISDG